MVIHTQERSPLSALQVPEARHRAFDLATVFPARSLSTELQATLSEAKLANESLVLTWLEED
jgi:hypothetical protein